jgi:cytochrome oxidase Cu insertion factor (SCO1/SenC/PrrC family)
MKVAEGGPDYTVDHSAGIFFIDPAGRLVSVLTPPHTADAVIARFKAVSAFILGKS